MIQWDRLGDFSDNPIEQRELCVELVRATIEERFSGDNAVFTTAEVWLRTRFGQLGKTSRLSEEDAALLFSMASESPEAWELAREICVRGLMDIGPPISSWPYYVRRFAALRLDGGFPKPEPKKRRGNTRSQNLYRDYFIHETLGKLYGAKFEKKPAREIIAEAFQRAGFGMITAEVVHHVQRRSASLDAEFDILRKADAEFRNGRTPSLATMMRGEN